MKYLKIRTNQTAHQSGFSLMEVMIGIVIFAIGMLALASLQGALTRSTVEAKVRTGAVNIAEEFIELSRGFERITFDPLDPVFAYNDIEDGVTTIAGSNGVNYTLTVDVTDYYYNLLGDDFTVTVPTGALASDYKTVAITVSWGDSRKFVVEEGLETSAGNDIRSGSILLSANISGLSVAATGRIAEELGGPLPGPPVNYTPGLNPDIVSLTLGDSKFKESMTPEPEVFRDQLETRFDVITYSTAGSTHFLRREEFVAVSCECTLVGSDEGKSPAIWAGDEYTEPEFVTKVIGEPNSRVDQSPLCDICCRDHHDVGGSSGGAYDPSLPTGQYDGGNHKHYPTDRSEVVGIGGDYVEACRMVRVDGFFRVGQDFRLEGLNTFPEDFLITEAEVLRYSDFITEEVYVESPRAGYVADAIDTGGVYQLSGTPPVVDTAPRTASGTLAAGDLTLGYTSLPTSTGANFQQLRSRSIYIDNLSSDLRAVITCIEGKATTEEKLECESGVVELDKIEGVNILEIIPFFEIQTTFLNDWQKENLSRAEFDITSDPIETDNTHSRGVATKITDDGNDMVNVRVNRGVSGLSGTDPINPLDYELPIPTDISGDWSPGDIEVVIGADTTSGTGRTITGEIISDVPGLKAAGVTVTASEAACSYISGSGIFTCFVPTGAIEPKMILGTFGKAGKTICISSSHPTALIVENLALSGSLTENVDLTSADAAEVDYVLTLTEETLLCGSISGG